MSSTSIWSGPESYAEESYPSSLLKHLLRHMMGQFGAQGACIALYDENSGQMKVQMHLRLRSVSAASVPPVPSPHLGISRRRMTVHLENDTTPPSSSGRQRYALLPVDEVEEVMPQQCTLFAVGTAYARGQDLIGYAWQKNEAYILSHEMYLKKFHNGQQQPFLTDIVPTSYLAVPIEEPIRIAEMNGLKRPPTLMGVVVLYQIATGINTGFHAWQRSEALLYVERIALYLQNDKLQRSQQRTSEYLLLLQEISTAFPTTVNLSDLLENMYNFVTQVVNVSSLLLTLYDRDTQRIYDVFAVKNGTRVDALIEQPVISQIEDRPVWWQVTQEEKRTLQFSPVQEPQEANRYQELLVGAWGDQRQARSFLFLPMKMFNRVVGSLCLTSTRSSAYRPEEVQVLETMVQIVTVGIENVKLYERDRQLLHEAKQRESQLAAINSALQSISSVLNVSELLNNFVEQVATLVKVDLCAFFQLSPTKEDLVAQAMYGLSTASQQDDGSDLPAVTPPTNKAEHDALINKIRFPFKGTFLEQMANELFFYLDASQLEDLAQKSDEGGAIFLQTAGKQMLMLSMYYQTELIGLLAVPIPKEGRFFRPKEVGTLMAICAQAASAIRNAQLFEQREEAYAEMEHMNKLKDEFLVTASHELRTPLSAIVGYTSLLKRQSARISPQQILRFATRIGSAAQQLLDLVENMTEAAQMGAVDKKLELTIGPVQVYSAAEIAASMLSLSAEQKVTLLVNPQLWVKGDALHFRQVISNLLDNAAKYSPPDSQIVLSATATTLSLLVDTLPENQIDHEILLLDQGDIPIVLIRVQDHGEGILPEDQQRIFEKFVRAPRSLTTPVRGSGLGLYICRRYVEAMGGKLWLERSIPGEGSTFSFYLPRTESPVEREEQAISENKAK